ncbi:MAG: tRNA (adenosine(37)-N6)-dimethylallyltransferase MiaA [Methylobacterium sp.]|nr:tRNA (adenosine(37)-N6)-dimethylallyltransferase MiaA [Methylobacterium sp.]
MAFATLIAGPTASGKSTLAIAIAERSGGSVVNADSMQVYADLRVLSARPTPEEEARVPHALFGFVPAGEEYSVGRYLADSAPLIAEARTMGRAIVIAGGTGLYFRALTEGLMPSPPINPAVRVEWRQRAAAGEDLHAALRACDPQRAAALHPQDTPRILRAIELFHATGRTYTEWLCDNPGEPLLRPGEWRGIYLNPPRTMLHARIDARFEAMMGEGAPEEVRRLLAHQPPLPANLGVMKAHGVPHLARLLRGEMDRAEAVRLSQQDTRAYARRQVIFARRYLSGKLWQWVESAEEVPKAFSSEVETGSREENAIKQ